MPHHCENLPVGVIWTGPVSSILVLGGSGDYFEVADTVIAMDSYVPANAHKR